MDYATTTVALFELYCCNVVRYMCRNQTSKDQFQNGTRNCTQCDAVEFYYS